MSDQDELTDYIRRAIRSGQTGALWEGGFPRYAWLDIDGTCFEARQLGPGSGQYKGYALTDDQRPPSI